MASRPRKPLKDRLSKRFKGFGRTQFTCSCGKVTHSRLQWNAHRCMDTFRGASKKAREAARNKGRQMNEAWKHARRTRLADGLIDQRGNRTAKGRARPELPARPKLRDWRKLDRFSRDSQRTDHRATRHEGRARKSDTRADRHSERAARHKLAGRAEKARAADTRANTHRNRATTRRQRVIDTRMGHHQRWPERTRT